ncbi:MAG: hypothetical protein LWX54_11710, partial [Deltaproteobacteria bacterium]|nr:hypothetical protein [Deltaproteobacteria bacterium]
MDPILALLFCTAFVAGLLILDHRRSEVHSIAGWIPTIWMLYCGSRPLGQWSESTLDIEDLSAAIIEGSAIDRNFLAILILVGLLILVRRKIDWRQVVIDNRWLFLLFLYMLVSILWSDYFFVSLKRWIKAFGGIVMVLVVLTGPSPFKEIESIFRRTIYILIPFSALLVKYFPSYGVMWGRYSGHLSWAGVTNNKNTLGVLCIFSALFLIWMWARSRKQTERPSTKYDTMDHVVVLGLSFWLLKGPGYAYSATSVVVLIIGLAILFVLRRLKANAKLHAMACLFLLVAGLAYLLMWGGVLSINPLATVTSLVGRNETLTGRDAIW